MVPRYPPFLELFQKCQQSPDVLTFEAFATSRKTARRTPKTGVRVSAAQTFKGVFGQ